MTKRFLLKYLNDILETIADIKTFTDAVDFNQFQQNREKVLAVIKFIEILGEAVKKIPDENREKHLQSSWRVIAGMRDILVHEYWGVDIAVIWSTVKEGIPPLKSVITEIKQSL